MDNPVRLFSVCTGRLRGSLNTLAIGVITAVLCGFSPGTLAAQDQNQEPTLPFSFVADEMDVDRNLGIITARGHVEANHGSRTLMADTISFNQRTDVLTATGNVTLLEPAGDVMFSEYMEMDGDFKNGIVEDIRLILSDSSRVAANGGARRDGDLDLRKVVYSPCNLCEDDPNRPPLWQIKAVKVLHDKSRRVVEYTDAWLEIMGVPVFYTPFLTHPDPTVQRESGFLTPTFGFSSALGSTLKTPYFWNISEHSDATLTPAVYSDQGAGLEAEYRKYFTNGEIELAGSIVEDDQIGTRGHIDSFGRFNIDPTWRWGIDLERASDDTYQRRYKLQSKRTLTSGVYAEGFRKNNYFRAESQLYQGLRAVDDDDTSPIVAPLVEFSHAGTPDSYGGRTTLDASAALLSRRKGTDSYRLSAKPGWENNYTSAIGEKYRFAVTLDADGYAIDDFTPDGRTSEFNGITGRLLPKAQLDWSLPLARSHKTVQQVVEPLISLIAAPNVGNNKKIPNEDSQGFEFDGTSLFRSSRFAGNDLAEGGSRVDYGAKWGVFGEEGGFTNVFAGQSFRFREDSTFASGSGLDENFSDFVATVQVSPGSHFDLLYRTRLQKDNLSPDRNEVGLSAGAPLLRLGVQYQMFTRQKGSKFGNREDVNVSLGSQLTENWSVSASGLRDITDRETRSLNFGTRYEDECFIYTAELTRSFFNDRDLTPEDVVFFRISFKTLGAVQAFY